MNDDDPRLVFIPTEKAVVPPAGLIEHIKDSWWIVHPTKGLVFFDKRRRSPQCNRIEELTRRFQRGSYPWAEVQFIPSVFRPINPQDYC